MKKAPPPPRKKGAALPPSPAPHAKTAKGAKKAKPGVAALSFRGGQQEAIFRAMLEYIRTQGASLRDVWETARMNDDDPDAPMIKDFIGFDAIREHAQKGGWVKQRDAFWKDVHGEVLATAKSQVIQDQIAALEHLQGVRALVLANVNGLYETDPATGERKCLIPPVTPNSLEGLINAYVRLDKHINQRTDAIMIQTVQGIPQQESPTAGKVREIPMTEDNLSDDEIAELARGIVLKRAGMAIPTKETEPTETEEPDPEESGE